MNKTKKCSTKYCRNNAAPHRTFCWKCVARKAKENNPAGYYYNKLRWNAKHRGIKFELTLNEFKQFCAETNYLELKGRAPKDMTIDRIKSDPNIGYRLDNIQVMSKSENSSKGSHEKCPF
jgi:hypothetical protein